MDRGVHQDKCAQFLSLYFFVYPSGKLQGLQDYTIVSKFLLGIRENVFCHFLYTSSLWAVKYNALLRFSYTEYTCFRDLFVMYYSVLYNKEYRHVE